METGCQLVPKMFSVTFLSGFCPQTTMKTNNCTKKKKKKSCSKANSLQELTHPTPASLPKKKKTKKLLMGQKYQSKHCRPGLDHIKKCGTIKVYTGCHPVYDYSSSPLQKKKKKILLNYKISPLQYNDVPLIHTIYISTYLLQSITFIYEPKKITP